MTKLLWTLASAALVAALVPPLAPTPVLAAGANPGACPLLTTPEVAAAFPGTSAGVPETGREKYGILGCEWSTPRGRFVAQYWKNDQPTTARAEAEGMILGALDPLKRSAAQAVRYEDLPGVGESAVIAIARRDDAKGVLNDMAVAVVVVRGRTISLMSAQLASGDPGKAIATLSSLAKSAAKR